MEISEEVAKCIIKLIDLQEVDDTESAHSRADDCITQFLKDVGFGDVAVEYEEIKKWYG